jgi:hypothetical protein
MPYESYDTFGLVRTLKRDATTAADATAAFRTYYNRAT